MESRHLQTVVKTAEKITRTLLPSLQSIYHRRVHRSDPNHPHHGLFMLLPSDRRYISVYSKTTRHNNMLFNYREVFIMQNETLKKVHIEPNKFF